MLRQGGSDHPAYGLIAPSELIADYEKFTAEKAALQAQGYYSLENQGRFKAGKLELGHEVVYWMLCLEGHSNLSALKERHMETQTDGSVNIVMFEQPSDSLASAIGILAVIVCDCSHRIHQHFASGLQDKFDSLATRLELVRQKHTAIAR
jgi:hypothetical protein